MFEKQLFVNLGTVNHMVVRMHVCSLNIDQSAPSHFYHEQYAAADPIRDPLNRGERGMKCHRKQKKASNQIEWTLRNEDNGREGQRKMCDKGQRTKHQALRISDKYSFFNRYAN